MAFEPTRSGLSFVYHVWVNLWATKGMNGLGISSSKVRFTHLYWLCYHLLIPLDLVAAIYIATAALILLVVQAIRR